MGHPADPLMRVGTSGTEARGKHYSNDPATAGLVFTSAGPDAVPTWAPPGGGGDIIVTRVLFVDAAHPAAGANGSLNHPFLTVQAAVDQVLTNAWVDAVIMVAPGIYLDPINIGPSAVLQQLNIQGWANAWPVTLPNDLPNLGGLISIASGIQVNFSQVFHGAAINSTPVLTADLNVSFTNCQLRNGSMQGNNIDCSFLQTAFTAWFINGTAVDAAFDGFSWSSLVRNNVVITPGTYARTFYDTGADYDVGTISATGLAIGSSTTVSVVYPNARPNEYAIASMDLVVAADYTVTYSHSDTGLIFFRLRNDSRASTNFAEPAHFVVFHAAMATIPVP